MRSVDQPPMVCTARSDTPFATITVAPVCRNVWCETPGRFNAAESRLNATLMAAAFGGFPSLPRPNTNPEA